MFLSLCVFTTAYTFAEGLVRPEFQATTAEQYLKMLDAQSNDEEEVLERSHLLRMLGAEKKLVIEASEALGHALVFDPAPEVRKVAAESLGRAGGLSDSAHLLKSIETELNSDVRVQSIQSFVLLMDRYPDEASVRQLSRLMIERALKSESGKNRLVENELTIALACLGDLAAQRAVVDYILEIFDDMDLGRDQDVEDDIKIIRWIGLLGRFQATKAIEPLIQAGKKMKEKRLGFEGFLPKMIENKHAPEKIGFILQALAKIFQSSALSEEQKNVFIAQIIFIRDLWGEKFVKKSALKALKAMQTSKSLEMVKTIQAAECARGLILK